MKRKEKKKLKIKKKEKRDNKKKNIYKKVFVIFCVYLHFRGVFAYFWGLWWGVKERLFLAILLIVCDLVDFLWV